MNGATNPPGSDCTIASPSRLSFNFQTNYTSHSLRFTAALFSIHHWFLDVRVREKIRHANQFNAVVAERNERAKPFHYFFSRFAFASDFLYITSLTVFCVWRAIETDRDEKKKTGTIWVFPVYNHCQQWKEVEYFLLHFVADENWFRMWFKFVMFQCSTKVSQQETQKK